MRIHALSFALALVLFGCRSVPAAHAETHPSQEYQDARSEKQLETAAADGDAWAMTVLGWRLYSGVGAKRDPAAAVRWWTKAAEAGDARAMLRLADSFAKGIGNSYSPSKAVVWLRKAAEAGDVTAMAALGDCYQGGWLPRNTDAAWKWMTRAADKGSVEGMLLLAELYERGIGVPRHHAAAVRWFRRAEAAAKEPAPGARGMADLGAAYLDSPYGPSDFKKALQWLRRAAELGDPKADFLLSKMYWGGRGVGKDRQKSLALARESAERGSADGMAQLGWIELWGKVSAGDAKEGLHWLEESSRRFSADGMYYLGMAYETGVGTPANPRQALRWYQNAYHQGSLWAEMSLARLYQYGVGTVRHPEEAIRLLKDAAGKGCPDAMVLLGSLALYGDTEKKDFQLASSWLHKAVKSKDPNAVADARGYLAWMDEKGLGCEADPEKAMLEYQQAAKSGNAFAMNRLAYLYLWGQGVPQDDALGISWLQKAAVCERAGSDQRAYAMGLLGYVYENGYGVPADREKALAWYRKGAALGDANAAKALKRLEKR